MQNVALFLAVIATVLSTASASCDQYKNPATCNEMDPCEWSASNGKCEIVGHDLGHWLEVVVIVLISIGVAITLAIIGCVCCCCMSSRASITESVVLHQQPAPGAYHPAQQQQVYGTNVQQVPTQGVVVPPEQKCEV